MSNFVEETEYSLIRHLDILCKQDEKYKDLFAVWTLDQEIYSKALTTVALTFPHYSMHDSSHSSSIINKIEMLLGEERIKSLSPTDTFMILESAYLHDFGMIIANAELVEEWGTPSFQRFLKQLEESTYDEDITKAANYLLNMEFNLKDNIKWPVEVRNYVTIISAEYFRKRHSIRSANWIDNPKKLGIDINFNKLIPERIMKLIGKVAISHGTSFEDVYDSLKRISNGIGTDRAHPRFIACLLRLGDLLDLDNGRFNPVTQAASKFPKSSMLHKEKHSSITHFLVCPEKIEVSAICKDDKVYRVTREWFDSLREELKNLSSRWSEIVPHKFQGGPPSLGDIKLSIENAQQITEQLDLRFSIDQERAFELIEGSGIYDSELIFVRELIQNALDATKMQIWKDIKSKKYDDISMGKYYNRKISGEKAKLLFYDDIPEEIRALYPISIEIIYKEPEMYEEDGCKYEKEAEYIFKIEDRGCGISLSDLKRMENVGGSWKQDDELADFIDDMPVFLKPTGSFGMGLHSVFMITDEMQIKTKSEEDKAFDISFVSRRKNGYISVKENHDRKNTGTEIRIIMKESKVKKAIENLSPGTSFISTTSMFSNYKEYDCLSDRYGIDTNLRNLAAYINQYIEKIKMFNISCLLDKKPIDDFKITMEKYDKDMESKRFLETHYDYNKEGLGYYIYFDGNGVLKSEVRDKKYSAIIVFRTYENSKREGKPYIQSRTGYGKTCFKEIYCDDTFRDRYFGIELNIFEGEAKEVLDVSRNELKSSIYEYYFERVEFIFKDLLNTLDRYLNENEDNKKRKEIIEEEIRKDNNYFESSMVMFRLAYSHYLNKTFECDWGNEFKITNYSKTVDDNGKLSLDKITLKEFIDAKEIILFNSINKGVLLDWIKTNKSEGIVASRGIDFERDYIRKNFKIGRREIVDKAQLFVLVKDKGTASKCFSVEKNSEVYKSIIKDLISSNSVRSTIYPMKYTEEEALFECLVVNELPPELSIRVWLSFDKYFIISPFISTDMKYLGKNIDDLIDWLKKEANFDKLVRFVVMNSVKNKGININENEVENHASLIKEVEDAYIQLIKDYVDYKNQADEGEKE